MTTVTAIIQARVGSTRLPGKVMYPLDGKPALQHVIDRVSKAESVDNVVVATSNEPQDDVLEQYVPKFGAEVVRGSESNVLDRFKKTVDFYEPDVISRVTGDCPLISPKFIDMSVEALEENDAEYVSAGLNRTFPRGLTCEVFTANSFDRVYAESTKSYHREHVTPYYREHPDKFQLYNVESSAVFSEPSAQNRTDLRLTLDEAADYELIETVYRKVEYTYILDVKDVIQYIDENRLVEVNEHVEQKSV